MAERSVGFGGNDLAEIEELAGGGLANGVVAIGEQGLEEAEFGRCGRDGGREVYGEKGKEARLAGERPSGEVGLPVIVAGHDLPEGFKGGSGRQTIRGECPEMHAAGGGGDERLAIGRQGEGLDFPGAEVDLMNGGLAENIEDADLGSLGGEKEVTARMAH